MTEQEWGVIQYSRSERVVPFNTDDQQEWNRLIQTVKNGFVCVLLIFIYRTTCDGVN